MATQKFLGLLLAITLFMGSPSLLRGAGGDLPGGDLTLVARAEFACRPHCLAAAAGRVFLAGENRLLALDVSDPGSPQVMGYCATEFESPADLVLAGDLGYLSSPGGLASFDLSDPTRPWQMGFCPLEGAADLIVNGKYAYLAGISEGKWGLHVVDVSNPHKLTVIGKKLIAEVVPPDYSLALHGKNLFLGFRDKLWILNVSDPAKPREASRPVTKENLTALSFTNEYLVLGQSHSSGNFLSLSRIINPAILEEVGSLDLQGTAPQRLLAYGSYLLLLGSNRDLNVVQTAPANHPRLAGRYHLPAGSDLRLAISGHRVYICDPDFGLWTMDLSTPSTPVVEKSWNFPDKITGMYVSGKTGCLVSEDLRLLDLANPYAPKETGIFPLPGPGKVAVAFGRNMVYAAAGSMLMTVDVSNLSQPNALGRMNLGVEILGISSDGKVAVAACADGLRVLDLTIPFKPELVGERKAPPLSACSSIALADKIAYVVEPGVGLKIIDIHKPKKPKGVGKLEMPDALAVAAAGNLVYVMGESSLSIVKVENKRKPVLVRRLELSEKFTSLSTAPGRLLLSSPEAGLQIYDLADPLQPKETGVLKPEYTLHGAAAQGNFLYTAEERWMGVWEMKNVK